jgi:plastocyanin
LLDVLAVAVAVAASGCSGGDRARTSVDPESVPREGVHGIAPAAANGVRSIISMTPVSEQSASEPSAGRSASGAASRGAPLIDQFGLSFSPQRLIISAGTTLEITNSEASLTHNVQIRSVADGTTLLDDDALPGDVLALPLEAAGGYDVLCDVHPGMTAFVYVTDAPWTTFAEADGTFDLGVVPDGDYLMRLWTVGDGYGPSVPVTVDGPVTEVDIQPER